MSSSLVVVAVLYVAICSIKGVLIMQDYLLIHAMSINPTDDDLAALTALAGWQRTANVAAGALAVIGLAGFVVWFAVVWRMGARNGLNPRRVLWRWSVAGWAVSTTISLALSVASRRPTLHGDDPVMVHADLLAFDRYQIAVTALRALAAILLAIVVWTVRRGIRAAVFGPLEASLHR